jgi:protein-L-isoaspartate(D-aspartate) O-methyltransferase
MGIFTHNKPKNMNEKGWAGSISRDACGKMDKISYFQEYRMDHSIAHFNMVEQQIRPWDVLDMRILDTVSAVPRHPFVPAAFQALAYSEIPIPLPAQQTMLEPKIAARFLQALNPQAHEQALEIGTGSGYLTALLAQLCTQVTSVELHDELRDSAAQTLAMMGINNVTLLTGDAKEGWSDNKKYHAIVLTGAVLIKPQAYLDKLEVGGRLVAVVGEGCAMQAINYVRSENNQWLEEVLFETQLPYFEGIEKKAIFSL